MSEQNKEISPEEERALGAYYENLIRAYNAQMPTKLLEMIRNTPTVKVAEEVFAYYNMTGRAHRFISFSVAGKVTMIIRIYAALKFFKIDRPAVPEIINWIEF